jgi:hypothetical protein
VGAVQATSETTEVVGFESGNETQNVSVGPDLGLPGGDGGGMPLRAGERTRDPEERV